MANDQAANEEFYTNPFRRRLVEKRPLIGVWAMLNSTSAIEGISWSGFDWLLIDGEHSPADLGDMLSHLRAMESTPTVPIVRIPVNDPVLFKRHLDIGARTIMVPMLQDPFDAATAVRAMRYPQGGNRGFAAMHRASRYGHVPDYVARASEGLFLIGQVETPQALTQVAEIAAVDGLDAVFFGPGDLSANMGHIGQPAHPEVSGLIVDALTKVREAGKYAGVLAPNPEQAGLYIEAGFDFVSVASDCSLLFSGAKRVAGDFAARAAAQRSAQPKLGENP